MSYSHNNVFARFSNGQLLLLAMTNVPLVENIARGGEYMCLELTEYPGDDIGALIGALDEFASVEARWRRGNGSNGDDRIEHHVTRMVAIPSPLKSANSRGSRSSPARAYTRRREKGILSVAHSRPCGNLLWSRYECLLNLETLTGLCSEWP